MTVWCDCYHRRRIGRSTGAIEQFLPPYGLLAIDRPIALCVPTNHQTWDDPVIHYHPFPSITGLIHYLYYKWIDRRFPYHLFTEEKFGKPEGTFYKVFVSFKSLICSAWLGLTRRGDCMGLIPSINPSHHRNPDNKHDTTHTHTHTAERGVVQVLDRVAHHRGVQGPFYIES